MTKTNFQKYAGIALASTVVIGGIASAAITPIPVISNTFAVAGQVIKSADINKLAEALNILDARTNGTAPTDPNHLADKEYVDSSRGNITFGTEIPITISEGTSVPASAWKLANKSGMLVCKGETLLANGSHLSAMFIKQNPPASYNAITASGLPSVRYTTMTRARNISYGESTMIIVPKDAYYICDGGIAGSWGNMNSVFLEFQ